MKKTLLTSTALIGTSVAATGACGAGGIKLGVGGFFSEVYMATTARASSATSATPTDSPTARRST